MFNQYLRLELAKHLLFVNVLLRNSLRQIEEFLFIYNFFINLHSLSNYITWVEKMRLYCWYNRRSTRQQGTGSVWTLPVQPGSRPPLAEGGDVGPPCWALQVQRRAGTRQFLYCTFGLPSNYERWAYCHCIMHILYYIQWFYVFPRSYTFFKALKRRLCT